MKTFPITGCSRSSAMIFSLPPQFGSSLGFMPGHAAVAGTEILVLSAVRKVTTAPVLSGAD